MGRTRFGVNEEVKETTESFYRALSSKSLKHVDKLWLQVPYAAVVGPSGRLCQGWDAVHRYWELRFQQLADVKVTVKLTKVLGHAVGDIAWVSGVERRTTIHENGEAVEDLRMTCVLQCSSDGWKLVSYHVSASQYEELPLQAAS